VAYNGLRPIINGVFTISYSFHDIRHLMWITANPPAGGGTNTHN